MDPRIELRILRERFERFRGQVVSWATDPGLEGDIAKYWFCSICGNEAGSKDEIEHDHDCPCRPITLGDIEEARNMHPAIEEEPGIDWHL